MDMSISIHFTEESIPEIMGLLAKMWDNPKPSSSVSVAQVGDTRVVTVNTMKAPIEATPAPASAPSPAPAPAKLSKEQLQLAAGNFMARAPGNLARLQEVLSDMGAPAVPSLRDEQLELFAQKLRELGEIL